MQWLIDLHRTNPTAQAIAILSLVCVAGMSLGGVTFRGVKLGTSGVLFAAILVGSFVEPIDHHTLEFVKELGLILFVFCIGMQLGPGFFSSLRQAGLKLNLLALAIILLGAVMAAGLGSLLRIDGAAVLGIFSGASTNTPSLGAAQQTLATLPGVSAERAVLPALAYAVSYPVGVLGIIGTLLVLKSWFRVDVERESSVQALGETHFVPLFVGICVGIVLGTLPIPIQGLTQPLRLGLAGGPLIVAILVGRLGRIGRLVWYMPRNASLAFREFGIALFFASVGLLAGPSFFGTVCSTTGLLWLAIGAFVTIAPLVMVGFFARKALTTNYVTLAGLLAGAMTDPPALAFANGICRSEAPALAYATVYLLTMLLRIMTAQILAVVLRG